MYSGAEDIIKAIVEASGSIADIFTKKEEKPTMPTVPQQYYYPRENQFDKYYPVALIFMSVIITTAIIMKH